MKSVLLKLARKYFLFTLLFLSLLLIPFSAYASFGQDLSTKEGIMNNNNKGIVLYDRFDRAFFSFYQGKERMFIPISQIPKHTQQAVIAMEDKDFYKHRGFSIKAIARSLWADFQRRDFVYGGSTLTQQLVKNTLLSPKKDFIRKFREIILAFEIEKQYSKNDILEMYLNSVYFGEGSYGVEEASWKYFNKPVEQISLAESTLLISLLPAPSRLSPLSGSLDEAKQRQKLILQKMLEQKYITLEEKTQAENEELAFNPTNDLMNTQAFHFAHLVLDELIAKYGEETLANSGFKIKTTIDLDWQDFADKTVKDQVAKLAGNRVTNGSTVVIDPLNGEIKALVGSKDWFDESFGKVDVAISPRQPGSSFKPIYYVAAFEKEIITPTTILKDQPTSYGGNDPGTTPYKPQNYDRKFRGQVLARRALANSLNVPSVEVLSKIGVDSALEMAKRLGITTLQDSSQYGLSLALGSGEVKLLELTNAYATFANQGLKNKPTTILEVKDKKNHVVYSYKPEPEKVLEPEFTFLISSILSDNKTRAEVFGNTLDISRQAAVKTGTTENYRDSWTIGYTPSLAIGAWVGNNDGAPMDNVAGSLGAAPIWKNLMEKFLGETPPEQFQPPEKIVAVSVCKYNGLLLKEATSSGYVEYFVKGTEPTKNCYPQVATPSATPAQKPPTPSPTAPSPTP